MSSASRIVTDMPGTATSSGAVGGLDRRDRGPPAGREHDDLVAGAPDAAGDLARVAAVVVVLVGDRPDHPLDGEAAVVEVAVAGDLDRLEVLEQRRPVVPGHPLAALDDVVAAQRRHRDHVHVAQPEPLARLAQLLLDLAEALLGEADEIHLVHRDDDVRDAEDRGDVRVAARLLDHALARVDEDDRDVRRRGARDHVARVLNVPRRVGELEAAARRDERAVGDVDRDPLLALGAQAVGEQREVDVAVAAALRRLLDVLELVGEDLLRVVEQPADQRRLAVVDRARRDEPEQLGRPCSCSEVANALPVLHRRLADAVVGARLAALRDPRRRDLGRRPPRASARPDATAPVQLMSPTVRKRTEAANGSSPSIRSTNSLAA